MISGIIYLIRANKINEPYNDIFVSSTTKTVEEEIQKIKDSPVNTTEKRILASPYGYTVLVLESSLYESEFHLEDRATDLYFESIDKHDVAKKCAAEALYRDYNYKAADFDKYHSFDIDFDEF